MQHFPTFEAILSAHQRIKPHIHRTPVFTSRFFDEMTGARIFFKCENLQRAGAFKIRGATNAVFSLEENELRKGVVTHSSGNHAQALALTASRRNTRAYIVMPESSPQVKVSAVKGYGGEVIFCKPTLAAREASAQKIQDETGAVFIPPYDHPHIIAGQGTAFVELHEKTGALDYIFAPVGGGGLLSGTAIAAKHLHPKIKVIVAANHERFDRQQIVLRGQKQTGVNRLADANSGSGATNHAPSSVTDRLQSVQLSR